MKPPSKEVCPTIYGPVKSRRHGLSLGINLGSPDRKFCTWGCVYCQCGMGERRKPGKEDGVPSLEQVLEGLMQAVERYPRLDSVTFAGNTEPTAHPQFRKMAEGALEIKRVRNARWVLNVLSNGSELHREEVVEACDLLDETWIKLDCGIDDLFQRLNRPLPGRDRIAEHLLRISRLEGPRIQTLLWKHPERAVLGNFTEENLAALLEAYTQIHPSEIHLTTVSRDTAVPGIQKISREDLERFAGRVRALGLSVSVFV